MIAVRSIVALRIKGRASKKSTERGIVLMNCDGKSLVLFPARVSNDREIVDDKNLIVKKFK